MNDIEFIEETKKKVKSKIIEKRIELDRKIFHYDKGKQIASISLDKTENPPVLVYDLVDNKFRNKLLGYDFKNGEYVVNKKEKEIVNYIYKTYLEKNRTKKKNMQQKLYKKVDKLNSKEKQTEKKKELER